MPPLQGTPANIRKTLHCQTQESLGYIYVTASRNVNNSTVFQGFFYEILHFNRVLQPMTLFKAVLISFQNFFAKKILASVIVPGAVAIRRRRQPLSFKPQSAVKLVASRLSNNAVPINFTDLKTLIPVPRPVLLRCRLTVLKLN